MPGSTLLARLFMDRDFWIIFPCEGLPGSNPLRSGSTSKVAEGFVGRLSGGMNWPLSE